jgi:glycosyltransferase involved in cell wall biosynthesis
MRIVIVQEYYLPGTKAGGPVRSLSNLVSALNDDFDFWILTRDRDHDDVVPYHGVLLNDWNTLDDSTIYYASPRSQGLVSLWKILKSAEPDVIYLNNLFSSMVTRILFLRRIGLLGAVPTVLAPRGALSPGAFALKRSKKAAFLRLAQFIGIYGDVFLHASSTLELADLRREFPRHRTSVAPNVPMRHKAGTARAVTRKQAGRTRLVFLSRMSPKKNFLYLLESLRSTHGAVGLDVYGTLEDTAYWDQCQRVMTKLPEAVEIKHRGLLAPEDVPLALSNYDFFVLPTLGENFGHAILEALISGCPVVISDRTPWRDLAGSGAGWDIPLDDEDMWIRTLQSCIDMGEPDHSRMVTAAQAYAEAHLSAANAEESTRAMFLSAAGVEMTDDDSRQ